MKGCPSKRRGHGREGNRFMEARRVISTPGGTVYKNTTQVSNAASLKKLRLQNQYQEVENFKPKD